jgi:hypothetical protein
LCAEKLAEAAYFQEVAQQLSSAVAALNAHAHVQKKAAAIQAKPAEAAANIKAFNAETEQLIKAEIARQNEKRGQLAQAVFRQLVRFEEKWNNEEFLLRYVKPSSHLLQVKKIEHSLILAKDFGKAEDDRLQVESLEKAESESAQRRAEEGMQSEHRAFLQKQESERAAFDCAYRRALTVFVHQREQQLSALLAREATLQADLDAVRILLNLPPQEEAMVKPRTMQSHCVFKTNVNPAKKLMHKTFIHGKTFSLLKPLEKFYRVPRFCLCISMS